MLVFLWHVRGVLIPFLLAGLLAYLLAPPVAFVAQTTGMERFWAILFVYALVGLGLAAAVIFLLPPLLAELQELSESIPAYASAAQEWVRRVQEDYHRVALPDSLRQALDESIAALEGRLVDSLQQLTQVLFVLVAGAVHLVLAPILAFYVLADLGRLRRGLQRLLPAAYRERLLRVCHQLDGVMSGFIRGMLLVALIVGASTGAILYLLGVPYALLLGIFAGAMELIPYFGPILGAIPAVLVTVIHVPEIWVQVVVALLIVQQLESGLISPKVIGRQVGLHPVLIIFALLVGGHLFGFWGLVLAAPIAGMLHVVAAFGLAELAARPRAMFDTTKTDG